MAAGAYSGTVSSNVGPGQATGTITLNNVSRMVFNFSAGTIEITKDDGSILQVQESQLTTMTLTPASKTFALS